MMSQIRHNSYKFIKLLHPLPSLAMQSFLLFLLWAQEGPESHRFIQNRHVLPGGSLRRLPIQVTTNLCVPFVQEGPFSDGPRGTCLSFAQPCCLPVMPSVAKEIGRVPEFIFQFRRGGQQQSGGEEGFIHWALKWQIRGNRFIFWLPNILVLAVAVFGGVEPWEYEERENEGNAAATKVSVLDLPFAVLRRHD